MDWTAFYVPDHDEKCYRLVPALGSAVVRWTNWTGTLEDCAKECLYDSKCQGFEYTDDACAKSARMQWVDGLASSDWKAYVRVGFKPTYWAGICSNAESKSECDDMGNACAWNRGRRGVNQFGLFGYCGRASCEF